MPADRIEVVVAAFGARLIHAADPPGHDEVDGRWYAKVACASARQGWRDLLRRATDTEQAALRRCRSCWPGWTEQVSP